MSFQWTTLRGLQKILFVWAQFLITQNLYMFGAECAYPAVEGLWETLTS